MGNTSTIKAEPPFNMDDLTPYISGNNPNRATRRRPSGSRIPDAVVVTDGRPPGSGNIRAVVEIKLGEDTWGDGQAEAYEDIAGSREKLLEITDQNCVCEEEPEPEPIRVPVPDPKLVLLLALLAAAFIVMTGGSGAIVGAGAA